MKLELNLTPCVAFAPKSEYAIRLQLEKAAEDEKRERQWAEIKAGFEGFCKAVIAEAAITALNSRKKERCK